MNDLKQKQLPFSVIFVLFMTGFAIFGFLQNIDTFFDVEKSTIDVGTIGAISVGVILIISFCTLFLIHYFLKKKITKPLLREVKFEIKFKNRLTE